MTMFSAENRRQFYGGYGGGYGGEGFGVMSQLQGYGVSSSVGSDLIVGPVMMAEDESRTESLNESSSKDAERGDEEWLQLSIGGGRSHQDRASDQTSRKSNSLVELDLMPSSSSNIYNSSSHSQIRPLLSPMPEFQAPRPIMGATGFSSSFFLQHPQQGGSSSNFPPHQEINWALRPMIPISIATASSSSLTSSPSLMASGTYFARPFQLNTGVEIAPAPRGPGVDFRVIQAPRRPHSGVWFMLQASQNQEKEPVLPQIAKSYLRIKDGRMTIRLVIKYLVNKLKLENESEIEIRCKGQRLEASLTLQHVRDNIWSSPPREFITLLPNSSTTHHIMVLHYARTTASN